MKRMLFAIMILALFSGAAFCESTLEKFFYLGWEHPWSKENIDAIEFYSTGYSCSEQKTETQGNGLRLGFGLRRKLYGDLIFFTISAGMNFDWKKNDFNAERFAMRTAKADANKAIIASGWYAAFIDEKAPRRFGMGITLAEPGFEFSFLDKTLNVGIGIPAGLGLEFFKADMRGRSIMTDPINYGYVYYDVLQYFTMQSTSISLEIGIKPHLGLRFGRVCVEAFYQFSMVPASWTIIKTSSPSLGGQTEKNDFSAKHSGGITLKIFL